MTGLGLSSIMVWQSNRLAPFMAPPNSVMSAPAMKVRPPQIRTIALTAGLSIAVLIPP